MNLPRSGYTLPVFACASAVAALRWLQDDLAALPSVSIDLIEPAETAEIAIEQVARLSPTSALAITRSDPGDNLDLTRHTPVWAVVELSTEAAGETGQEAVAIELQGGEGVGRILTADQPAIYTYARRLLETNLRQWSRPGQTMRVTVILPEGRLLAERTSNAAFGVVEGLSLLGTSGIAQPLSAPGQLEAFRRALQQQASLENLVFCIGENGLDLAQSLGIKPERLLKTANWLGSMLVEAGVQKVQSILLFGYHGKLIKLAGGIFHTHHHVADARQEILAAHCVKVGLPTAEIQQVLASSTTEAGLKYLRELDATSRTTWVEQVYGSIADQIDQRAEAYIYTHSEQHVQVGSILFDRDRQIIVQSRKGDSLLSQVC
ncbi:cobalt-precorrin-5B (C(1))-methyltransferase [Leptolyngbya sp. NK1-12]|uniref:Cobalt-precorrin-5B C(1)-methyltransferase n=1 Tax=Leptolyngbya sp. NK1-12 TaxID=2547451 RepID=A0AA96WF07_9CYAN|nr:cobalt-precorrin-5B (C(1))-methyltransferase CbiD [Leptolyngbya sp. NK1-12]WNZ23875.1 cobalt-precorrin-5B (C(1))-methyltransferase [Leptolyngbya sp. NK1-12]